MPLLVYSHHPCGGGKPLDSLWFSAEACRAQGVDLRFVWTGSRGLGLRGLLANRRVLFDGAFAPGLLHGPKALRLARMLGRRIAIYWHETEWIVKEALAHPETRSVLSDPRIAHLHVCEAGRRMLIESYGVNPERVRVVNNMSRLPGLDAYALPRAHVKGLFMTAGFLGECKGVDLFLEIAERVCKLRPESRFIWMGAYGRGRYSHASLRKEVLRRGLDGRVFLVGQVENAAEALTQAESVFLTSRSEGMPKVLIEALALGKPAVAFDVGGVSEVLGGRGVLVPAGDVAGFSEALAHPAYAMDDESQRRRRQRYDEHFTESAFAKRFAEAVAWWDGLP